jgi:hypothetical protein
MSARCGELAREVAGPDASVPEFAEGLPGSATPLVDRRIASLPNPLANPSKILIASSWTLQGLGRAPSGGRSRIAERGTVRPPGHSGSEQCELQILLPSEYLLCQL